MRSTIQKESIDEKPKSRQGFDCPRNKGGAARVTHRVSVTRGGETKAARKVKRIQELAKAELAERRKLNPDTCPSELLPVGYLDDCASIFLTEGFEACLFHVCHNHDGIGKPSKSERKTVNVLRVPYMLREDHGLLFGQGVQVIYSEARRDDLRICCSRPPRCSYRHFASVTERSARPQSDHSDHKASPSNSKVFGRFRMPKSAKNHSPRDMRPQTPPLGRKYSMLCM